MLTHPARGQSTSSPPRLDEERGLHGGGSVRTGQQQEHNIAQTLQVRHSPFRDPSAVLSLPSAVLLPPSAVFS